MSERWAKPEPMDRPEHPDKAAAERAALEADLLLISAARHKGYNSYVNSLGKRAPVPMRHGWRGPR